MTTVVPIDDAPIQGQKYMCVCIVSPHNEHNKAPVSAFKVKYVAETEEECRKMAKRWRDTAEEQFDIYVGPIGKWLPLPEDPNQIENIDYQQSQLTEFIMGQRQRDQQAKQVFEERVRASVEAAQHPLTRNAVELRNELYQAEKQMEGLKKVIEDLNQKLHSYPEEVIAESKESFKQFIYGDQEPQEVMIRSESE